MLVQTTTAAANGTFLALPSDCCAGQQALLPAEVRQLVGQQVRSLLANRIRWEQVAEFEVLEEPFRCGCSWLCLAGDLAALRQSSLVPSAPSAAAVAAAAASDVAADAVAACSVDDGTLTRTMKPRRAAIMSKYAAEVARLERRLR